MTIRQLRDVSAGISTAAVVLIGASLFWSGRDVDLAIAVNAAASEIGRAVSELRYLAVDTVLHYEPRAQEQWRVKQAALATLLARQRLAPAQQEFVLRIGRNRASLGALYPQLLEYHQAALGGALAAAQSRELEARIATRLLAVSQEMISDTFRLGDASQADIQAAQRARSLVILVSILVIGAIVTTTWVLITRSILRPIARLQGGTEIIAAGSLDHRMEISSQDEIGALARAFDDMTGTIQQTQRLMLAANKELEAFAYSVSHDLRAPLRSVDGFSLALLEDYADKLDDEGRDTLNRIRAASQRMGILIDDMLKLSQVTRRDISVARVDLSELAAAIVDELRQAEPDRRVEFIAAPGLSADTDPHLMRIALVNLLGNAWKFTGKRAAARIEFGLTDNGGSQAYFVRDNGAGFDMAYADKLFGAFQRMHGVKDFAGTGIGLATVQRILHRLRGRVWAEAVPNQGATFFFTLNDGGRA